MIETEQVDDEEAMFSAPDCLQCEHLRWRAESAERVMNVVFICLGLTLFISMCVAAVRG